MQQLGEKTKLEIRNIRKAGMNKLKHLKTLGAFSEDDLKRCAGTLEVAVKAEEETVVAAIKSKQDEIVGEKD